MADKPVADTEEQKLNRLGAESSPYLLQHARNPVDWFPWGEEALQKARDEDKPIFLSVGYSACHWCHVMEHESFEDDSIARVLNENFVSIKVDREERPDLDQIYMNAVMALRGGGGGWPLSVFLTPDQEVFFGGTYWPPKSRMGMPGFDHVLHSVLDAFTSRREQVTEQSQKITAWLNESDKHSVELKPTKEVLQTAASTLAQHFDYEDGGFGSAPKFPHAMDLRFLTLLSRTWDGDGIGREGLLEMVLINCKKMAYGGIFDHLGGGFARYSVDEKWLVPHFEKMLYDNALLADVYLEMFQATGDAFFKMVATKTLDYVLNYLTDEQGAFYSTEDADSEGVEGKFYVWDRKEIFDALDVETATLFCELYNVTERGNFEDRNILNMTISYQEFADRKGISKEELRSKMKSARAALLQVRDKRIRPGLDDKVLVSWNALAIHAMARAGMILQNDKYGAAAEKAAQFILDHLRSDDGRLLHTWRHGKSKLAAYLDDYSYLIVALVEVYQYSQDEKWIDAAVEFAEQMVSHFGDRDGNGFFFTADDHEQLIARTKAFQDSSVPSGNAMAATALLRLGRLVGKLEWIEMAENTMSASMPLIQRSPMASGQMLVAVQQHLDQSRQFVLVAETSEQLGEILPVFKKFWEPSSLLLSRHNESNESQTLQGMFEGKVAIDCEPTLYICSGVECLPPVVGQQKVLESLL